MSSYDSWKTRSDREDDGDPIFVECEACGGSAVQVIGCWVFEHGCGFAHRDTDEIPCPACDGFGEVEIKGNPLTLEDLDAL